MLLMSSEVETAGLARGHRGLLRARLDRRSPGGPGDSGARRGVPRGCQAGAGRGARPGGDAPTHADRREGRRQRCHGGLSGRVHARPPRRPRGDGRPRVQPPWGDHQHWRLGAVRRGQRARRACARDQRRREPLRARLAGERDDRAGAPPRHPELPRRPARGPRPLDPGASREDTRSASESWRRRAPGSRSTPSGASRGTRARSPCSPRRGLTTC